MSWSTKELREEEERSRILREEKENEDFIRNQHAKANALMDGECLKFLKIFRESNYIKNYYRHQIMIQTHLKEGGFKMAEHEKRFVWVKDKAGNEYVCRIDDLKDPKKVDEEDLKNCIDDASRAINIGD